MPGSNAPSRRGTDPFSSLSLSHSAVFDPRGGGDFFEEDEEDDVDDDEEVVEDETSPLGFRKPHKRNVKKSQKKKRQTSESNRPGPPQKKRILCIQMDFCTSKTLRHLIDEGLPEDEEEVWRLFRQIAEGWSYSFFSPSHTTRRSQPRALTGCHSS